MFKSILLFFCRVLVLMFSLSLFVFILIGLIITEVVRG